MAKNQTIELSIDSSAFRKALDEYASVIAEQNSRLTTLEREIRTLKDQMKVAASLIKADSRRF